LLPTPTGVKNSENQFIWLKVILELFIISDISTEYIFGLEKSKL
jgi:hypothetical protein